LESIQGSYFLTDPEQKTQFQFDHIDVNGNDISLHLNEILQEKYTFKQVENDFLTFEKIYSTPVSGPEVKKIQLKIFQEQQNNLLIHYKFQGSIIQMNLIKNQ
jgi:hypothetical protein